MAQLPEETRLSVVHGLTNWAPGTAGVPPALSKALPHAAAGRRASVTTASSTAAVRTIGSATALTTVQP